MAENRLGQSPRRALDLYLGDLKTNSFPWDTSKEIWFSSEPKPNMRAPFSSPTDSRQFQPTPWRAVLYTTGRNGGPEPKMVDDIIEFRRHNSWPHFTVDRRTGAFNQHIPINIGARSLANTSTGRSFNADHFIQIEIVGNSVNSQSWSIAELNVIKGLIH